MKRKTVIFVVLLVCLTSKVLAAIWEPEAGHKQIAIWPAGKIPDNVLLTRKEYSQTITDKLVAGKPWTAVGAVSQPTITIYRPKKYNTGTAMVVFPGGGYWILAIDLEGSEICNWLTSNGISCILLKYRVPGLNAKGQGLTPRSGPYPNSPMALEDAQRAIKLTRFNAKKWHINPNKIGVIGFSAGGHLVAAVSTLYNHPVYNAVDKVDHVSSRPDFGIALYPGHLWLNKNKFKLNSNVPVSAQTPPMFIVQAENDPVDSINNSLVFYRVLQQAKVPTELHLYAHGGHAFGARVTKAPITHWPKLAIIWLHNIHML